MAHALALGTRGIGRVWPNPAVGCVLVRDGRIVGRGRTADGGRPHAERVALDQAGEAARGATAYVTLEPCAHHGRTPPCAEALVAAGVRRVVTATDDPDPRTAGAGHARLQRAGIAVTSGVMRAAAEEVHAGFMSRVRTGRPLLTLKLATSFDGRIATAAGESRWITGPASRHFVHGERLRHDAVLVGAGTVRTDDPALTVRSFGQVGQPVRLVASRHLRLGEARRLKSGDGPLWLLHGDAPGDIGASERAVWSDARLLPVAIGSGGDLDPKALLEALGEAGLTRVFCEGGGTLAASFLAADLVDELVGFTAGLALGAEGRPSIGALGVDSLAAAPRFRLVETWRSGDDVGHRWRRAEAEVAD